LPDKGKQPGLKPANFSPDHEFGVLTNITHKLQYCCHFQFLSKWPISTVSQPNVYPVKPLETVAAAFFTLYYMPDALLLPNKQCCSTEGIRYGWNDTL